MERRDLFRVLFFEGREVSVLQSRREFEVATVLGAVDLMPHLFDLLFDVFHRRQRVFFGEPLRAHAARILFHFSKLALDFT